MSAKQSGDPVPPELNPPTDLFYPELELQSWYDGAQGNSDAVDWSTGLINKGFWSNGVSTLNWSDSPPNDDNDGRTMLLNENIGNNKNESDYSPFFLRDISKDKKNLKAEVVFYNESSNRWERKPENSLEYETPYWYWVIDAPIDGTDVPGPLPLLGAGAAFGWSRRLRQRVKQASAG